MTDITDKEKRDAREWAERALGGSIPDEELADIAARVILATVEAPAPTIADELRDRARTFANLAVCGGMEDLTTDDLNVLASRAEQIEEERDEAMAAEADHLETIETLRVEAGRLTTQVARQQQLMKLHGVTRDTVVLPDVQKGAESANPADVPSGEAWWVSAYIKNSVGGINVLHGPAFRTLDRWCVGSSGSVPLVLDDDAITLLRRLVPAPRTVTSVEELDALPFRSVILSADDKNPDVYQRDRYDEWLDITAQGYQSGQVIRMERSVTVLYQPKEDQK